MSNVLDDVKTMERHMRACRFEGCAETLAKAVVEIERLRRRLHRIASIQGCECDMYYGYKCALCKVRKLAGESNG